MVFGLSFMGIEPDDTYVYTFRLSRTGLTGTTAIPVCRNRRGGIRCIIIDAGEPEPFTYDREHVVMLSDWTDENPHSLLKKLKKTVGLLQFQ